MKRISTLIVLIGLVTGAVLTGCDSGSKAPDATKAPDAKAPDAAAATNAAPAK